MNEFESLEKKYLDLLALSSTTSLKRTSSAPMEKMEPQKMQDKKNSA